MSQTARLVRRKGTYHYRRRVPDALVAVIGKREVHHSLGTSNLSEAKKRRTLWDLRWDARFQEAASEAAGGVKAIVPKPTSTLSEVEALRLVQSYVAGLDQIARRDALQSPPANDEERHSSRESIETGLAILQKRDDPRADEWITATICKLTQSPISESSGVTEAELHLAEIVRRGLIELERRKLSRLDQLHSALFFDTAFDPSRVPEVTFGEMCRQLIVITEEEAEINGTSQKWVDKQRANVALLKEIVGENTSLTRVDYDACLRVRGILARLPANRTKLFDGLSIDESIAAAQAAGKPTLSPVTQDVYIATLRAILDLSLKKRLILVNPADGMKPLRKDTVAASAKRLPFTVEQLKQFFEGSYYRQCAQRSPAWSYDKQGWRFWLPLLCLFMGMRPNEACQMAVADVQRTEQGIWYLDIVASDDEDDDMVELKKKLKTAMSRRRIPVHPELVAIGFLAFVEVRRKAGDVRLFPDLKADQYGNYAKYALKRFREVYLPAEIDLAPRQSFYSFRHNFRDALRAVGAPPDALQALGGWSQGHRVSDAYGDKSNPDYQARFIERVAYLDMRLEYLHYRGALA